MYHKNLNINGTDYPIAVNIAGAGAPTASTAAEVGMFYMDTDTGDVYKCTAVSGSTYTWDVLLVGDQYADDIEELQNICIEQSVNLFDASLQTDETISPHYFYNGAPYPTTNFDKSYNTTAPIPVEPSTQYTVGLVPALNGVTKPWGDAVMGVFFYDRDGAYISASSASSLTFTTPDNAYTIRFNYSLSVGVKLPELNARCMLVKGNTLPEEYVKYYRRTLRGRVNEISEVLEQRRGVMYKIVGDAIHVLSPYDAGRNLCITMKKRGGNNIFDFARISVVNNGVSLPDMNDAHHELLQSINTDFHSPFIIKAIDNIDGDKIDSADFTGGNHDYSNHDSSNTDNPQTATGRTASIKFFVDGEEKADGYGECTYLKIVWENFVQAMNTKKVDGTGREVLREKHEIVFDGFEWKETVELIPLEDIHFATWYGFQYPFTTSGNAYVQFLSASNRQKTLISSGGTVPALQSGNLETLGYRVTYEDGRMVQAEIDPSFDLGKREYVTYTSEKTKGAFTSGRKCYFSIIRSDSIFNKGFSYFLRGRYLLFVPCV